MHIWRILPYINCPGGSLSCIQQRNPLLTMSCWIWFSYIQIATFSVKVDILAIQYYIWREVDVKHEADWKMILNKHALCTSLCWWRSNNKLRRERSQEVIMENKLSWVPSAHCGEINELFRKALGVCSMYSLKIRKLGMMWYYTYIANT